MMLRFFTLRFNFLSSGIYTCSTFPAFLSRISTFFDLFTGALLSQVLYMGNSGVAVLSAYPRGVYGIFFK